MEHTKVASINTKLADRILWYDGDSTLSESGIVDMISTGVSVVGLFVDRMSNDINQYNALVPSKERITTKDTTNINPKRWMIPDKFKTLDPITHILAIADSLPDGIDKQNRLHRVADELVLYDDLGLLEMLTVLVYVINTLQTNNVVWGVGRGSSVSSYVLYLLGVHDVDSYAYDLPIEDFLH